MRWRGLRRWPCCPGRRPGVAARRSPASRPRLRTGQTTEEAGLRGGKARHLEVVARAGDVVGPWKRAKRLPPRHQNAGIFGITDGRGDSCVGGDFGAGRAPGTPAGPGSAENPGFALGDSKPGKQRKKPGFGAAKPGIWRWWPGREAWSADGSGQSDCHLMHQNAGIFGSRTAVVIQVDGWQAGRRTPAGLAAQRIPASRSATRNRASNGRSRASGRQSPAFGGGGPGGGCGGRWKRAKRWPPEASECRDFRSHGRPW